MSPKKPIRILVMDDHEIMRRGLRSLLETHEDWEVCAEAADGRAGVKLAAQYQPQVVVMDLGMPELNGFEAARKILEKLPKTAVLILSMHESEQMVREVLAVGVRGYVLKSDAGRDLLVAVEALLRGESFFNSPVAARMYAEQMRDKKGRRPLRQRGPLTAREREILQLLAEGKTNRQVGESLQISVKTAETHRARVMRKLSLDSVAKLVRYAIRNGIVEP